MNSEERPPHPSTNEVGGLPVHVCVCASVHCAFAWPNGYDMHTQSAVTLVKLGVLASGAGHLGDDLKMV